MQYYLHDGKKKHGPFSPNELKDKLINEGTSIWREGLDDWTKAGSLDELRPLFVSNPPPFKKHKSQVQLNAGKAYILLAGVLIVIIIAWITNPNADQHRAAASIELNKKLEQVKSKVNPKKKLWKILKEVTFTLSSGLLQNQINQRIISDDYYVCSLTKVKLKNRDVTVGIGAFGNVWLFTDLINEISPDELIN